MYRHRLDAILLRIKGLSDAAHLLAQFLQIHSSDSFGMQRRIGNECFQIYQSLGEFIRNYECKLPRNVQVRLHQFLDQNIHIFSDGQVPIEDGSKARAAIILLTALSSELNFLLSDEQETLISRTERSFLHLQQVIAANSREREVWQKARRDGEVDCEKLGAAHLLWHGIYAFKISGEGARTDLVAPELPDPSQIARATDGLILTEWKLVTPQDAKKQYCTAFKQAQIYSTGVLIGIELRKFRFLVGVSEDILPTSVLPSDFEHESVIYRHINIAVNPKSPSVQARRGKSRV